MIDCEVKGVTTRGGKTTTQDAQNDDTAFKQNPNATDSLSSKIEEGKRRGSAEEILRKPEAAPYKSAFHRSPSPNAKDVIADLRAHGSRCAGF
ncbi:hypothetical protein Tco_0566987 [Tanacetum coccineum]